MNYSLIQRYDAIVHEIINGNVVLLRVDGTGFVTTEVGRLCNNPRASLPKSDLDTKGLPKIGARLSLVELRSGGMKTIHTLDAFCYNPAWIDKKVVCQESKAGDPDVTELMNDLMNPESLTKEYKASIYHPANPADGNDHWYQTREILKQCIAGANSQAHRIRVYVGVKETRTGARVCGMENEPTLFNPRWSKEDYVTAFLNMAKQYAGEEFLMSLSLKFIQASTHTVLRIDVEHSGKDIVLYGKEKLLFVRVENAMHEITSKEAFLSFIRNYR